MWLSRRRMVFALVYAIIFVTACTVMMVALDIFLYIRVSNTREIGGAILVDVTIIFVRTALEDSTRTRMWYAHVLCCGHNSSYSRKSI